MSDLEGIMTPPLFKDRKTRLLIMGVLQIMFGGLILFGLIAIVVMTLIQAYPEQTTEKNSPFSNIIPTLILYAALSLWFFIMGFGSVIARRWARALTLISSWLWLIFGVPALALVLWFLLNIDNRMTGNNYPAHNAELMMQITMMAMLAVIYVIIPAFFILMYSGRHVKATCETYDPKIRWTDRCPLPVLGLGLMLFLGGFFMLNMASYNWAVPLFGVIFNGVSGAVIACLMAIVQIGIAWGLYKLNIKAWWALLFFYLVWLASAVITFSIRNFDDLINAMSLSGQQLQMVKQNIVLQNPGVYLAMSVTGILVMIVYLLFIRRYFLNVAQAVLPEADMRNTPPPIPNDEPHGE